MEAKEREVVLLLFAFDGVSKQLLPEVQGMRISLLKLCGGFYGLACICNILDRSMREVLLYQSATIIRLISGVRQRTITTACKRVLSL